MSDAAGDAQRLALAGQAELSRGLLDRAADLANQARALAPDCVEALRLATEIARARGDLVAAGEAARLWDAAAGNKESRYSALLLTGQAIGQRPYGRTPVPFVIEDDFLSRAQLSIVTDHVADNLSDLNDASVAPASGVAKRDAGARSARVLRDTAPVKRWFVPLLLAYASRALPRLGVAPFLVGQVELQITASFDGDFYEPHQDMNPGIKDRLATRRLSFVYYFRLPGGSFSGGFLKLYDFSPAEGASTLDRFTAIQPLANRLLLFRSQALHEVMAVEAPGGRPEDGRFAVNGWIHALPRQEPAR